MKPSRTGRLEPRRGARGRARRGTPGADVGGSGEPEPDFDILDAAAISLPCARCGQRYEVTLRQVTISQDMMHQGCPVPYPTECPPLAQARLFRPAMLKAFETAWARLEQRAEKMGGVLVLRQNAKKQPEPAQVRTSFL